MQFNSTGDWAIIKINERPGTLTFDIKGNSFSGGTFKVQTSEDGTTYTDLATYTTLGSTTQSEEFKNLSENVRYIKWVYTNKSSGNVALGNIALATYVAPQYYTLTVGNLSNVNLYVFDANDETNPIISGEGSVQVYNGTSIEVSVDVESGYEIQTLDVDGVNVTSQIDNTGMYTFTMPEHDVTITATATEVIVPQTNTYTLATSITSGKHYVIANEEGTKVMGGQNENNRAAVGASLDGTTLSVDSNAGAIEFVIYGPNASGHYTIYDDKTGYLYAASSSSNHLKTRENNSDANSQWTISITEGIATITAQGTNSRKLMRFNPNNNNPLFACYATTSTTGTSPVLYEKSEATPTETKTLNGSGYATYCSQNALDFTNNTDVTAWIVTAANSSTGVVTFSQITGKAPAGTGMLLKGGKSAEVTLTSAKGKDDLSGNLLIGTTSEFEVINNGDYYGLSGNTFVPVNAGSVPAGKALLSASEVGSAARLSFVFEDDTTTGISTMHNSELIMHNEVYNLNGQRVNDMKKGGLYIMNGKKVIMK